MEKTKKSVLSYGLVYGALTSLALIGYFLLMSILGLHHIVELRFLNGIIMAIAVCYGLYLYKRDGGGHIPYFDGLGLGVSMAAVASFLFAIFMLLYVGIFSDDFLTTLQASQIFNISLSPFVVFAVIMLEGVISGFMIAFIAMQFFKTEDHKTTT